uniref:Uncharacterized protein n=1 Tax=Magallana gigas TaxID=29159 RepID=K1QFQ1_MAGGI
MIVRWFAVVTVAAIVLIGKSRGLREIGTQSSARYRRHSVQRFFSDIKYHLHLHCDVCRFPMQNKKKMVKGNRSPGDNTGVQADVPSPTSLLVWMDVMNTLQ